MSFEDTKVEGVSVSAPEPQGKGEVGIATPSCTIKQMWYNESFVQKDKKRWVKKSNSLSLKRFAQGLSIKKDEVAISWFANKNGKHNSKRSDANIARIATERQATKSSRKKSSQNKAAKAEAAATIITKPVVIK